MRSSTILRGLLVLGILAFATLAASHAAPSTLLIRGATIIDGLSDAPLRDRSLLIEGNTIRGASPLRLGCTSGSGGDS